MGKSKQAANDPIKSSQGSVMEENAALSRVSAQGVYDNGILGKATSEHEWIDSQKDDDTDIKEVDCQSIKEFNDTQIQNDTSLQMGQQEPLMIEQTSSKQILKACKGPLTSKLKGATVRICLSDFLLKNCISFLPSGKCPEHTETKIIMVSGCTYGKILSQLFMCWGCSCFSCA